MDRSWMLHRDKFSSEYVEGVRGFLNLAKQHTDSSGRIRCPCKNCNNCIFKQIEDVKTDLFRYGFVEDYFRWTHHGEPFQLDSDHLGYSNDGGHFNDEAEDEHDETLEMLDDIHKSTFIQTNMEGPSTNTETVEPEGEIEKFARLLNDAQRELYPGCKKYSKLSFLMKMIHNKTITNSSNKSFSLNLKLFKDALPEGETLPESYYEVKKLMRDLGLDYINIDACMNDCILYRKEYEHLDRCPNPNCQAPRWKSSLGKRKKIAHKVARYFPLKPRLQRLYMSKEVAEDMRWHKEKRVNDDILRHPADAKGWQEFDMEHDWFALDPRNVRLGLASDGFNPFGNMSTSYSMWPVILLPYNLPPWKCMKEPFLFLSMLIPGKDSPGNDIDVYLQPLIDELKDLWENGVETYDAYTKEKFRLHAALLWTINDFPAYGMLSGWSTKGKLACPVCNKWTDSVTLKHGQKQCYMGHRRYLDREHPWRKSNKFDGKTEYREKPPELSGDDILIQTRYIPVDFRFGKPHNKRKRKRTDNELNWTKRSIFFELPYWKTLKLRHNLDVMHIEKNICETILGTLMNTDGKTKDNVKSRLDLEEMGIRKELHLKRDGNKLLMPVACYTLPLLARKKFCEWLKSIKFPDGYCSNLSRCVNVGEGKLSGMKSHDYHVFMQRVLPATAHGFLRKDLYLVLSKLSSFFKDLCSKTISKGQISKLQSDIALILCKLEGIYPPSFFVIMIHLAIHLPREVELGGPVHYRWMYFIERFLGSLKDSVGNKARPEGSIAEAYINKECLNFCSMYFRGVETRYNRLERNFDGEQTVVDNEYSIFSQKARTLGAPMYEVLSDSDFKKIQWYILNNCEEIEEYLNLHLVEVQKQGNHDVQQRHQDEFSSWFKQYVIKLNLKGLLEPNNHLYILGLGPDTRVTRYTGIIVNGVRFHSIERDTHRRTQNSGIVVKGVHNSKEIDFYGQLIDIIEFEYSNRNRVFIFKCDWWNVGDKRNGLRTYDKLVSVNVSRKWYTNDPFVLATQVEQVFYIDDAKNGGSWKMVQKINPRNIYNVPEIEEKDDEQGVNMEPYQQFQPNDSNDVQQINVENNELLNQENEVEEIDGSFFSSQSGSRSIEKTMHISLSDDEEEDDTIVNYCDDEDDSEENVDKDNDSENEDEDDF